jgi:hypothetical protein
VTLRITLAVTILVISCLLSMYKSSSGLSLTIVVTRWIITKADKNRTGIRLAITITLSWEISILLLH